MSKYKLTPEMIKAIEQTLDNNTNVEIHIEQGKVAIIKVKSDRKLISKIPLEN